MGPLEEATKASIDAAIASEVLDPVLSAGPIAAILALAAKIDCWDTIVQFAQEDAAEERANGNKTARPKVPEHDGTSHTAYLRYADQLNIMPPKGKRPAAKKESALGRLRAVE